LLALLPPVQLRAADAESVFDSHLERTWFRLRTGSAAGANHGLLIFFIKRMPIQSAATIKMSMSMSVTMEA
jgi:hypothetical protein